MIFNYFLSPFILICTKIFYLFLFILIFFHFFNLNFFSSLINLEVAFKKCSQFPRNGKEQNAIITQMNPPFESL